MDQTQQLTKLLETDGPRLHALLFRITLHEDAADDLFQDLFLRMSNSAAFLRADNPVAYVFRCASNLAFDWRRSRQRRMRREVDAGVAADEADEESPPLRNMIVREELNKVLNAVERLPESQREVIVMRYLQQLSHLEIAAQTGRTAQQVRGLCAKAIHRLRALTDSPLSAAGNLWEP